MKKALLIATGEFDDGRVGALRSPVPDAQALAALLADPDIGDYEVGICANQDARSIRIAVERLFSSASLDDTVLLHISGHGVNGTQGFAYCPSDIDIDCINATGLAGAYLRGVMNDSRCRRQLVFVDCCYSGAFGDDLRAKLVSIPKLADEFNGSGRAIVTSSTSSQQSFEFDGESGWTSVFTRSLVIGIESGRADANGDGVITLQELYDFAFKEVRDGPVDQSPSLTLLGVEGDLEVVRTPFAIPRSVAIPGEIVSAAGSPFASIRRAALDELSILMRSGLPERANGALDLIRTLTGDPAPSVSAKAEQLISESRPPQRRRRRRTVSPVRQVASSITVNAAEFYSKLTKVAAFCSTDRSRPSLCCVRIEGESGELVAVGTDSYRLAVATMAFDGTLQGGLLLPVPSVSGLPAPKRSGQTVIRIGDESADIEVDGRSHGVMLADGAFPNWRDVVPVQEPTTTCAINRFDLVSLLEEMAAEARRNHSPLHLALRDGEIEYSFVAATAKAGVRLLKAKVTGALIDLAFNAEYLLSAVVACDGAIVKLEIFSASRPVVVCSATDMAFRCLVMPVRIPSLVRASEVEDLPSTPDGAAGR